MLRRNGARQIRADSLPWLTGSEVGRRFLAAAPPRALARGVPAARCPAVGLATDPGPGTMRPSERRAAAAATALRRCLAALPERPGAEPCGCGLVALDRVLTVARGEMAYATGITARLRAPRLGIDGVLIAEDEPGGTTLLRDLRGPVARLSRPGSAAAPPLPDPASLGATSGIAPAAEPPLSHGPAALTLLADGTRLTGRREAVGFRRGRLAERIYLEDASGRRAVLLIGFSPAELAASAGAGLAWPGAD
ncbi:hypothetical protein [Paralimibaculum aggregatum]|uniref:hypothetical protein n=1 Tax=Paralimibaculum aggregatum TaxID=3036245 RepID=UPI002553B565|nr:hypothetical protein [Limibaculum sp. NKW23]